jgi:hypothetical protein
LSPNSDNRDKAVPLAYARPDISRAGDRPSALLNVVMVLLCVLGLIVVLPGIFIFAFAALRDPRDHWISGAILGFAILVATIWLVMSRGKSR